MCVDALYVGEASRTELCRQHLVWCGAPPTCEGRVERMKQQNTAHEYIFLERIPTLIRSFNQKMSHLSIIGAMGYRRNIKCWSIVHLWPCLGHSLTISTKPPGRLIPVAAKPNCGSTAAQPATPAAQIRIGTFHQASLCNSAADTIPLQTQLQSNNLAKLRLSIDGSTSST